MIPAGGRSVQNHRGNQSDFMQGILGTEAAQQQREEQEYIPEGPPSYMRPPVASKVAPPPYIHSYPDEPKVTFQQPQDQAGYDDFYEKEYERQLALLEMQEREQQQAYKKAYPEGMGMPGIRAEINPNPYLRQQENIPVAPTQSKHAGSKDKVYDLGKSSIKGGIFSPPDTSAARGKAMRFNPSSGTYTSERPY